MTSEAQKRFLRKRFARMKEEEVCCDCPGCKTCRGFVRNCTCDLDLEWYRVRYGRQENGEGMADQGSSQSLPGNPPEHVDPDAYREFGF